MSIQSDTFSGSALKSFWIEYVGDLASSIAVSGGLLNIFSTDNTGFTTSNNDGTFVAQSAPGDFNLQLKINNAPTLSGQHCGFFVVDDPVTPNNYLLLRVRHTGSEIQIRFYHATLGGTEVVFSETFPGSEPLFYRLVRVGTTYTAQYSLDGLSWVSVAGGSWAVTLPYVGIMAASFFTDQFDAYFDYFLNLSEQPGLELGIVF